MCDAQTWSIILIGAFSLGQMLGAGMLLAGYMLRQQWLAYRATNVKDAVYQKRELRAR